MQQKVSCPRCGNAMDAAGVKGDTGNRKQWRMRIFEKSPYICYACRYEKSVIRPARNSMKVLKK